MDSPVKPGGGRTTVVTAIGCHRNLQPLRAAGILSRDQAIQGQKDVTSAPKRAWPTRWELAGCLICRR